ncbi:MAG TPA: hypothetical protein VK196_09635 [Magnetospirillum sp.]|nr:hypothetical protein [Magnetospirillum sp.]
MKRIRVHGSEHVQAALSQARELGRPVTLVSPVALSVGIGWWRELMGMAARQFPDMRFEGVLDCGPSAGLALAALRTGAGPVMVNVAQDVREKLADIARQAGTRVETDGPAVLDLLEVSQPAAACRDWLGADDAGLDA